MKRYIAATTQNSQNNQRKVAYIALTNKTLALAAALALASAIPYFLAWSLKAEQPVKIQIIK
jgi:hypothetical protein